MIIEKYSWLLTALQHIIRRIAVHNEIIWNIRGILVSRDDAHNWFEHVELVIMKIAWKTKLSVHQFRRFNKFYDFIQTFWCLYPLLSVLAVSKTLLTRLDMSARAWTICSSSQPTSVLDLLFRHSIDLRFKPGAALVLWNINQKTNAPIVKNRASIIVMAISKTEKGANKAYLVLISLRSRRNWYCLEKQNWEVIEFSNL